MARRYVSLPFLVLRSNQTIVPQTSRTIMRFNQTLNRVEISTNGSDFRALLLQENADGYSYLYAEMDAASQGDINDDGYFAYIDSDSTSVQKISMQQLADYVLDHSTPGPIVFTLANDVTTLSTGFSSAGGMVIDFDNYTLNTVTFQVAGNVSDSLLNGVVQLWNLTTNSQIALLNITGSVSPQIATSSPIATTGENIVEVRYKLTSGDGISDFFTLIWAGLKIT